MIFRGPGQKIWDHLFLRGIGPPGAIKKLEQNFNFFFSRFSIFFQFYFLSKIFPHKNIHMDNMKSVRPPDRLRFGNLLEGSKLNLWVAWVQCWAQFQNMCAQILKYKTIISNTVIAKW